MYVLQTDNFNFLDEFPPEAAGQRKGHIFHHGFPPEGAPLLKADICRREIVPPGANPPTEKIHPLEQFTPRLLL